jgi:hypothetical protein
MESLTRLVTESLARHGFDRPLDYRRLRWSRWFRCESHHSLLLVPSKPGVFAVAEEIADFVSKNNQIASDGSMSWEGRGFSRAVPIGKNEAALAAEGIPSGENTRPRRMLAVAQFFEADDMAFMLDRMLVRQNPMRECLNSGQYFIRFVIIEEPAQRRSVCTALNQWLADAAEKASGIPAETAGIAAHFAGSLELTSATEYVPAAVAAQSSLFDPPSVARAPSPAIANTRRNSTHPGEINRQTCIAAHQLDSGCATNIHCPSPLPSGF